MASRVYQTELMFFHQSMQSQIITDCPNKSSLYESNRFIYYSKFDKHQDLIFVFQGILVMEYPNSVTDM